MAITWKKMPANKEYYTLQELPYGSLFIFGKRAEDTSSINRSTPLYVKVSHTRETSLTRRQSGHADFGIILYLGSGEQGPRGCISSPVDVATGEVRGVQVPLYMAPVTLVCWDVQLAVCQSQKP